MSIEKLSLQTAGPTSLLLPRVVWEGGRPATEVFRKTFGEPIPKTADIRDNPVLLTLFGPLGLVGRIQKKLVTLSRKKGKIVPAKGVIASALSASEETDFENLVFVGVEFLEAYHPEEETIAGVLAHEWGHLISEFPKGLNPDELTWDQIFELRKEEEAAADAYAGEMLFLMGQTPAGLIRFLTHCKKENLKYHSTATRTAILRRAFEEAKRHRQQIQRVNAVLQPVYGNPLAATLIAVV